MIEVGRVRLSLRNYRGSVQSAERIGRLAMERLEQLATRETEQRDGRQSIHEAQCTPLRMNVNKLHEITVAERIAFHAWQSIRERI